MENYQSLAERDLCLYKCRIDYRTLTVLGYQSPFSNGVTQVCVCVCVSALVCVWTCVCVYSDSLV